MSDEQDVSPYLHFPGIFYCSCNCMCWVAGAAQVRARDFDYFSTDFVRSVFVVYAHDSI